MTSGRNRTDRMYDSICPCCEADHQVSIPDGWTGNRKPRKYCKNCRMNLGIDYNEFQPIRYEFAIIEGR